MIESKFGSIISSLRKEMNLTQKDLADKLGISDKAVSRWETGKSYPTLEMIYQISKFFNVPFNDLMTARVSDNDENDIVAGIVKEFNKMSKRTTRILKVILIILLAFLLVVTGALIFSNTYNKFHVYGVHIESDDFIIYRGTYIDTNIKDTLNLGSVKLKNIEVGNDEIVSADLYYVENGKEFILQSYSTLDNIYFSNYTSYIEIDELSDYFNDLYLKVKVINKNNEAKEYIGKLEFTEDFSNNKLYNNDEIYENDEYIPIDLTDEEIKIKLLENGFEEVTPILISKNDGKYEILYYVDLNNVEILYSDNNLKYDYIFNLKKDILNVLIVDDNNVEMENYQYDYKQGKIIECHVGKCNNYDDVMVLIKKNFLNLLTK